jgi:hypothetical protein
MAVGLRLIAILARAKVLGKKRTWLSAAPVNCRIPMVLNNIQRAATAADFSPASWLEKHCLLAESWFSKSFVGQGLAAGASSYIERRRVHVKAHTLVSLLLF